MSITGNNLPVYATSIQNTQAQVNNATGAGALGASTGTVTLYTAGSNGSRVYGLFLATTDTAQNNVFLQIKSGSNYLPISQIPVPANSGNTAGTACVDGLAPSLSPGMPFDGTGKPYIELAPSAILVVSVIAAVTATKVLYITAIGADY